MALFSILTPVYNPPAERFEACIAAVLRQTEGDWEWCLVDDGSAPGWVHARLAELAAADARVRVERRSVNGGIVAASSDALQASTGDWVVLLDQDDELDAEALAAFRAVVDADPEVDFIYSDESLETAEGEVLVEFQKPGWSPSRMRSQMYTGHLTAYRADVVRAAGGFREGFDGAQDYDLALRVSELARGIAHVPQVLYHWVANETSVVHNDLAKPWAYEAGVRAVQAHCDRVGIEAMVEATDMPGVHRLVRSALAEPLVSVIVPTRGTHGPAWGEPRAFVVECVRSLLERSTYRNVEVVCVYDTATPHVVVEQLAKIDPRRVRLVEYHGDFNFSRKVNIGAFHARGDRLLFLNDDTEVISEGWIEAMLRLIEEGDVGIVGARLLFPNRTVQHGGQFMPSGPGHILVGSVADDPGPQYALLVERECEGVTAACSMMRRDVFELVGGFTERLANNFNDVDLCLKVRSHGMRIVWTPFAELWHFESVTRDNTVSAYELGFLHDRWETAMARDRYFAPNLIVPPREWDRPLVR